MCQVPIKQKSLILLIHWIIREVQLLEIRKHTYQVTFTEINDTYG